MRRRQVRTWHRSTPANRCGHHCSAADRRSSVGGSRSVGSSALAAWGKCSRAGTPIWSGRWRSRCSTPPRATTRRVESGWSVRLRPSPGYGIRTWWRCTKWVRTAGGCSWRWSWWRGRLSEHGSRRDEARARSSLSFGRRQRGCRRPMTRGWCTETSSQTT